MTRQPLSRTDLKTVRRRRARTAYALTPVAELESRRLLSGGLGWTTGMSLPAPATAVSATAVGGGAILLFGNGSANGGSNKSVQTLGAGAIAWSPAASLDRARDAPGAAWLSGSGEVIVFGGYSPADGSATDSVVKYDTTNPALATPLTTLDTPRQQFAFATDGAYAYAIGGVDDGGSLLSSVEQYDPSQDNWSYLAALPQAVSGASAVYDGAGNIVVAGGTTAAGVSGATYTLNIASNTWSTGPSLPVAETSGAAVLGTDGKIDLMGGVGASGDSIPTVQRLDPATGTWSVDTPLPMAVSSEAAVVDSLGRIEVIGGESDHGGVATPSAAVYVTEQAPVFTSVAPNGPIVVVGNSLAYTASASGTPAPTFALVNPPAGAQINSTTGAFSFAPSINQTGQRTIDVRASNALGQSDQVFAVAVQAPAVTGVTVTGASTTTISLSWKANLGSVAYYRVYMDGQLAAYDLKADHVIGTSTTITGLTSQAYGHTFYVTSFDAAGNESAFSTPVVGRTWFSGQLQSSVYNPSVAATHPVIFQLSNPTANPAPTTFAIVSGAPAGMTINPTTGLVNWLTTDANALHGYFPIFSSTNAVGTVTLTVGIAIQNNYPAITVTYPGSTGSTAYANLPFKIQFTDGSGAPVTWHLNSAPAGATLSSTGLLTWTPTVAQALASGSVPIGVTATNYAGSSSSSVTVPLLTASAPIGLTYAVNVAADTIGVNWAAPTTHAAPVASYQVTATYSYSVGGSGRGGGGSHTYTYSKSVTVSASTLSTVLPKIGFAGLPRGRTRFALKVVELDASGVASAPAVAYFTV